jgi:hypothetical protein
MDQQLRGSPGRPSVFLRFAVVGLLLSPAILTVVLLRRVLSTPATILLRRRCSAATTTEATARALAVTTELRVEATWCSTALLVALAELATAVATLTIATGSAASSTTTLAALVSTKHATRRCVRTLLLDVGGGDNLGGQVKPLAEVVETLRGQGVVVPLPGELSLKVAAGSERLACLDDLKICQYR